MEHVTFLGSSKREGLLGTGARSNAYTDFHHTVFHVHAPLVNTSFGEPSPMLPQVGSFLLTTAFWTRLACPRLTTWSLPCGALLRHARTLSSQ